MSTLPTLSVVMANYNHAQYLPNALRALVEQSVQPTEIIVIDDGSTDNSVEVIQGFADKYSVIKFFRNETNRGAMFTVHRGLAMATGDFVFSAAADDEVMPGFIEKSFTLLAKYPHAGLSCGITEMFEPHSGLKWLLGAGISDVPRYFSPAELVTLEQTKRVFFPSNTVMWRRTCLLEMGSFRADFKWHTDTVTLHAIAYKYGLCYVPEILGYVNVLPNSYFQKGRKDKAAHRALLEHIMGVLTTPEFEKQTELMRQAGTLYRLEGCILSVLWRNKKYRPLISWPFLRKHLWYSLQVKLKPYTPAFIGNLYLKLAGYRAK